MTTKDFLKKIYTYSIEDITSESFINSERASKTSLSKTDINTLSSVIAKFKNNTVDYTLKCILYLSIWEPDLAIEVSRKKGAFRYRGWGLERNHVSYLLQKLKQYSTLLHFSKETVTFLDSKLNLVWLFDFYKNSEQQIVGKITQHYSKRFQTTINGILFEESLSKELLAFADLLFNQDPPKTTPHRKDKLAEYSIEEITEGISYVLYLCRETIPKSNLTQPIVIPQYVLSDDIQTLILLATKVCALQEWEICVDYFAYIAKTQERTTLITPPYANFEKSIRLGYVKSMMQSQLLYSRSVNRYTDTVALSELSQLIREHEQTYSIKEVGTGQLSHYRFEFPEPLLSMAFRNTDSFYQEEIIELNHFANEFIIPLDDLLKKKVTENCTLQDVLLFKRFFVLLDHIVEKQLLKQKNKQKVIASLLPNFSEETLVNLIGKYIGTEKASELASLFTYNPNVKLDLQYTPFFKLGNSIPVPVSLVAKSNFLRNCIAYSYLLRNQIVNQDDKEHLVIECERVFSRNHREYQIFTNKHFKYQKHNGEIDVLVITDASIFIIECKAPLEPTSNFELRASYDHIQKAAKQLTYSMQAFSDPNFRKEYLKCLGIQEKNRNIYTCILMGNRLFNGLSVQTHPVRYIHELDMILNEGKIHSSIGDWHIWKGSTYSEIDLVDFLSNDSSLISTNFDAMKPFRQVMHFNGRRIEFESYLFDTLDAIDNYDKHFGVENRDENKLAQIKKLSSRQ